MLATMVRKKHDLLHKEYKLYDKINEYVSYNYLRCHLDCSDPILSE